jgi:hypothetical protein
LVQVQAKATVIETVGFNPAIARNPEFRFHDAYPRAPSR